MLYLPRLENETRRTPFIATSNRLHDEQISLVQTIGSIRQILVLRSDVHVIVAASERQRLVEQIPVQHPYTFFGTVDVQWMYAVRKGEYGSEEDFLDANLIL